MKCTKCNNDMVGAERVNKISKKTGKPYSAFVCPTCKNFNFINDNSSPPVTRAAASPSAPSSSPSVILLELSGKIDKLIESHNSLLREIKLLQKSGEVTPNGTAEEFGGEVVDSDGWI